MLLWIWTGPPILQLLGNRLRRHSIRSTRSDSIFRVKPLLPSEDTRKDTAVARARRLFMLKSTPGAPAGEAESTILGMPIGDGYRPDGIYAVPRRTKETTGGSTSPTPSSL